MSLGADLLRDGLNEIDQQTEVCASLLVPHHFAVARDHRFKIQLIKPAKCRAEIFRVTAEHVRHWMDDEIAGHDDLFFWQENYCVAGGVPTAEMHDPHFSISEIDVHFGIECQVW